MRIIASPFRNRTKSGGSITLEIGVIAGRKEPVSVHFMATDPEVELDSPTTEVSVQPIPDSTLFQGTKLHTMKVTSPNVTECEIDVRGVNVIAGATTSVKLVVTK